MKNFFAIIIIVLLALILLVYCYIIFLLHRLKNELSEEFRMKEFKECNRLSFQSTICAIIAIIGIIIIF